MKVVFTNDDGLFVCRNCSFEERMIPKKAQFRWDTDRKRWYTPSPFIAARLESYCDDQAKKEISKVKITHTTWAGPLVLPENEKLRPFQTLAAYFALARNRSYLGLDPGLGKTPIAAVVCATLNLKKRQRVVYICPPFLMRNTEAEFRRWAPGLHTERWNAERVSPYIPHVVIVPDSLITRPMVSAAIAARATNARTYMDQSLLIVDEAHRFKNDQAQRTRVLFGTKQAKGLADNFDRVLYLSGTPMPNRPIELYPVLSHSAPETIDGMTKFEYGRRYCAAYRNEYGWDFSGASNMKELGIKVRSKFMLRMRKDEVLKELPPKTEEMVLLEDDMTPTLSAMNSALLARLSPEDLMAGRIQERIESGELHLSTYRKELGIEKVKSALPFLKYLLEETHESILIFAIHKAGIETLTAELLPWHPVTITGETPMARRHELVKEFQTSKNRRVFIGNIQAAGVGLTLTKATRVVFVEFSWVPAENEQAADRAHRIGQVGNVHVQYLVFKNSIDRTVIEAVLRKRKVTAHV